MIYIDYEDGGDPFWLNVILLLSFDNTGSPTTFTDLSTYTQSLSIASGSPSITSTGPKFGAGALTSLDPTNYTGRIVFIPGAEGNAEEYTIEFWLYPFSIGNQNFGFYFSSGNGIIILAGPLDPTYSGRMLLVNNGAPSIASTSTISLSAWTHVAISRQQVGISSWMTRLFINGTKESESTSGLPALSSAIGLWQIGRTDLTGNSAIRGRVDDFRITAGVARYVDDFTIPAEAFPAE